MSPPSKKPNNVSYSSMELVMHNSDLVREILQWLPTKSLVKFRSVCKEWLFLIFSTAFKQQHTLRGLKLQQQSLILQTAGEGLPLRSFHLNPTSRRLTSLTSLSHLPPDWIIVQSSNGLLLLRPPENNNEYFYVHNPATRQSRKIIPPHSTTHPRVLGAVLAFDPSKSPYYELICFRCSSSWESRAEVYSSKSHIWKEISLETYPYFTVLAFTCLFRARVRVYWNNAIYWCPKNKPHYCRFDIAKRVMDVVFGPASDWGDEEENAYWRLQESNGHLYHVELMGSEGGCESVAVWELDDHHHWHMRQRHVLTSTAPAPGVRWEVKSTSFVYLVDTCSLLICRDGWMRFYNLNTGSYEDFPLDAIEHSFVDEGIQFRGTLALV